MPMPGACRPDCGGIIETRRIFVTKESHFGDFAHNADITIADEICAKEAAALYPNMPGTFRAMLSDVTRYAATMPFFGDCSDDWPIQPFTAYVNVEGQLVWVTGELRMLGIPPGAAPGDANAAKKLLAPISTKQVAVWTGLSSTWQTASTCQSWRDPQQLGTVGEASLLEHFLDAAGESPCAAEYSLICVEV